MMDRILYRTLNFSVMGLIVGLGPAIGAAVQGDPFVALISGGLVLGLYGAALIGVGFVVGGLGWPQFAGPVVVGLTLTFYLFDLIGDTVNTASRIETAGIPGAVCLSGTAWQQVDHLSVGRSLGRVEVKGKDEIEIVRFERFR